MHDTSLVKYIKVQMHKNENKKYKNFLLHNKM